MGQEDTAKVGKMFKRPQTAEEWKTFWTPPPVREKELREKDLNHKSEYMDDIRYNDTYGWDCVCLNGEFIGPHTIGIDLYAYELENCSRFKSGLRVPFVVTGIGPENATLTVNNARWSDEGLTYKIKGHWIGHFYNYKSDHPVRLMTLEEIRKEYCPQVKEGKVLYMINKFFILRDVEMYKVAEEFIWKVEVLPSIALDPVFDNINEHFNIIRIYTKTHHNWHPMYLD